MLKYKLAENNDNVLVYHYYEKEKERPGKVAINKVSGKTSVLEQSENDFGNRFAFKVISRLNEFFKEGNYKTEGIIAWY